jgi:hypothetical protein
MRYYGGKIGNATLPRLGLLRGEDEEVEGFRAELLVGFSRWWRARMSSPELAARAVARFSASGESEEQGSEWRQ